MQIGFLPVTVWDVLDVLIVGFLIFQIYRLLRGSVAFNIFIGVVLLYLFWWLVKALDMELLSLILGQFVSVGVIILIIIFQPEVRKFLLYLGDTTLKRRSFLIRRFFEEGLGDEKDKEKKVKAIHRAMVELARDKLGALIVLSQDLSPDATVHSGISIDAKITSALLTAIFKKQSPLHDGAVLIAADRIALARCILPVSQKKNLPSQVGLRHRAALGVTEDSNACGLIVSEETGKFSYAAQGELHYDIDEEELLEVIRKYI